MLTQLAFQSNALAQLPVLSDGQRQWLGERIFANECGGRFDCLTAWNEGENFPSLGIGHFIWFRAEQQEPFEQTFPALLAYYQQRQVVLPRWLQDAASRGAPWSSRQQFHAELAGPRLTELRQFLADTAPLQVDFIIARLHQSLQAIVTSFPASRRQDIRGHIDSVARSSPPLGLYALIDYLHFKGSGLNPAERYRGQGWGLAQVLDGLPNTAVGVPEFVASADRVLIRRVRNSPPERREQRWLEGWQARLRSYLPAD